MAGAAGAAGVVETEVAGLDVSRFGLEPGGACTEGTAGAAAGAPETAPRAGRWLSRLAKVEEPAAGAP